MEVSPDNLGNSTQEQELLRAAALWAADCAEQALPLFESQNPVDKRPREAVEAGREYGHGKKRDKNLRTLALAAFRAGNDIEEAPKHAARAASLVASIAYTHTDIQTGISGSRQARHILGPAVHAAYALELAAEGETSVSEQAIQWAVNNAPVEVQSILKHMPPQPIKDNRLDVLFSALDTALRAK